MSQIRKSITSQDIEAHLVALGGGNHRDNMAQVRAHARHYLLELSAEDRDSSEDGDAGCSAGRGAAPERHHWRVEGPEFRRGTTGTGSDRARRYRRSALCRGRKAAVMGLKLKHPPEPEYAKDLADVCVEAAGRISGLSLDYSTESLSVVKKQLDVFAQQGLHVDQIASTPFCFGCYVGELLVRNLGGKWLRTDASKIEGPDAVAHGGSDGQRRLLESDRQGLQAVRGRSWGGSRLLFSGRRRQELKARRRSTPRRIGTGDSTAGLHPRR